VESNEEIRCASSTAEGPLKPRKMLLLGWLTNEATGDKRGDPGDTVYESTGRQQTKQTSIIRHFLGNSAVSARLVYLPTSNEGSFETLYLQSPLALDGVVYKPEKTGPPHNE
jgi:hypothetical protein